MEDTSLLDEGDGRLQVLGHAELQHDAGQPPPGGGHSTESSLTHTHTRRHAGSPRGQRCGGSPAEGRGGDLLREGQILSGGDQADAVADGEEQSSDSATSSIDLN